MPHKRAKRSVREQQRSQKNDNLAPAINRVDLEDIPKSVTRVLDAARIRSEWNARKRKLECANGEEGNGEENGARALKKKVRKSTRQGEPGPSIKHGESLAHFNKRVEAHMAPLVKSAVHTSAAISRKVRAGEKQKHAPQSNEGSTSTPLKKPGQDANPPKEFSKVSSAAPRRVNDIVLAPPQLTKRPRGNSQVTSPAKGGGEGVVSMAQKMMMEVEREKAILRYREMKERRKREQGG